MNKSKGSPKGPRLSERRCVACREMIDKRLLVRVVRSPDSVFALDGTGKAAGRGAYICKSKNCFAKAQKARSFDRSFKGKVPSDVYEKLEAMLDE